MALLTWDAVADRLFETGVDRGVLYTPDEDGDYGAGVPWNGLTGVTESPSGGDANAQFADNIKYLNLLSAEEFGGTIEAFTYPDEFAVFDGAVAPHPGVVIGQQNRAVFGLCYRTLVGNPIDGNEHGYKLHLVYGAQVSPSEKAYQTVNDSPSPINFSWTFSTTPVPVTGHKPTSLIVVDSTVVSPSDLAALEALLYGTNGSPGTPATLPDPDAVLAIFA